MSSRPRARTAVQGLAVAFLGVAMAASACGAGSTTWGPPAGSPPAPRANPLPADCDRTITRPDEVGPALASARPGATLCFTGDGLAGIQVDARTSGAPGAPVRLIADGAALRGINITADYVELDGFSVLDGEGVTLQGTGLVARNNVVRNAASDGIVCSPCTDAIIDSNTVQRADGSAIFIEGERIDLSRNTVTDSVRLKSRDADGIRFFGRDLRITDNTIRDIKQTGYGTAEPPHTDCFQTYDNDSPPTFDVVITNNVCENVDAQCLIATGAERRNRGTPDGARAITFARNSCAVNGSQAILLDGYPDVVVAYNRISGPRYRGANIVGGSVNVRIVGNTILGDVPPFDIDPDSQQGFLEEGNRSG